MRVVLGIEYNGSHYHGWAYQSSLATIEGHLQQAVSSIANHQVKLHCAGRTDAGVHASFQVVHFDTIAIRKTRAWVQGCNTLLPHDIRINWAKEIDCDFHARFSATKRRYHYLIYNYPVSSAIFSRQVSWIHYPLNHDNMAIAAKMLIGEHDFSTFRDSQCGSNSPVRQVIQADVYKKGRLICVDISANAFLHHMVRNIVGSLVIVGRGQQKANWIKDILQTRDRRLAGPTAAAQGLCLTHVQYPKTFDLSEKTIVPMAMMIC